MMANALVATGPSTLSSLSRPMITKPAWQSKATRRTATDCIRFDSRLKIGAGLVLRFFHLFTRCLD